MGKTYDSIEDFVAAVESALPKAMEQYLGPELERVLEQFTQSNVYGHYTPQQGAWVNGTTYHATYTLLGGIESWVDGNTLFATSVAPPNPSLTGKTVYGGREGEFYTLLESPNTGLWRSGFPRPVVGPAQLYIDENIDKYTDILVRGLEEML